MSASIGVARMTAFRQIFQNSGRVNSFTAADFEGDRRYVRLRPLAPTNDPNGARIRAAQVAAFEQQLRDLGLVPQQSDEANRRELNNNPTEAALCKPTWSPTIRRACANESFARSCIRF